jgi:hypothetical protein
LLQLRQVGKVLWPTDRAFVLDEMLLAQDKDWDAIDLGCDFVGERIVIGHAGKSGQQVDAVRHAAKLNDLVALGEINRYEFRAVKPNSCKSATSATALLFEGRTRTSRSPA